MELFEEIEPKSGAVFSANREYRYALYRIWNPGKPLVMFIGLNPSTANEDQNDPTIRRVIGFAKQWDFGGVYMMNLFPLVSPYPERLTYREPDPMGDLERNERELLAAKSKCDVVVFAWGSFREAQKRALEIAEMFPNAYCMGRNTNGSPKHPLYLPKNVGLEKFRETSHLNQQG